MRSSQFGLPLLLSFCFILFLSHSTSAQLSKRFRPLQPLQREASTASEVRRTVRVNLGDLLTAKRAGIKIPDDAEATKQELPQLGDETPYLPRRDANPGEVSALAAPQNSIPTWSDSFSYHGLTYTYKMVGTDPKAGSQTTVIPTVIIPLRFVFPDGQVFDASTDIVDGQTAIQGIVNSPIFQNYNFVIGGRNVGNTQFGDAFQRANFWDSVGSKSRNYHVLLSQPTVLATQTIIVPDGLGHYETDFSTGLQYPVVDNNFLLSQSQPILVAGNVTPGQLPIMVWGSVSLSSGGLGFHPTVMINGALQTYIGVSYQSQYFFNGGFPDVSSLSHEVIEWIDDPFINNYIPGWNRAFLSDSEQCDSRFGGPFGDILETADPVENFAEARVALPGGSRTYHVVEGMFIDFYTRSSHSRSVNGQYSMFEIGSPYGLLTGPSTPCTGHVEVLGNQGFHVVGSNYTAAYGINNFGSIVGAFLDDLGASHGYLYAPPSFQVVDYPGALQTSTAQINDSGLVVGDYVDSVGFEHGFSFKNGQFIQIDFPGALATAAFGVNNAGDIVGSYIGVDFHQHGFLLRQGIFSTIDMPFRQVTLATGVNSLDSIVGFTSQFGLDGTFTGFLNAGKNTLPVTFPGAAQVEPWDINDSSATIGIFSNSDGYSDGYVTIGGYPYEVNGRVFGLNDNGQIVGSRNSGNLVFAIVRTLPSYQKTGK